MHFRTADAATHPHQPKRTSVRFIVAVRRSQIHDNARRTGNAVERYLVSKPARHLVPPGSAGKTWWPQNLERSPPSHERLHLIQATVVNQGPFLTILMGMPTTGNSVRA